MIATVCEPSPKSLTDIATRYGELFKRIDAKWQESKPTPLSDPHEEEIRRASCADMATEKKLAGAAADSFTKKCESDKAAASAPAAKPADAPKAAAPAAPAAKPAEASKAAAPEKK